MKIYFVFKICGFVLFAVFSFDCSTVNTSSFSNKLETKILPSPTPTDSPQNHEAKYINPDGWEIPLPEKRKKTRVIERDVKTEDGKIAKRTLTIYSPTDDFFFHRESFSQDSEITTGLLKLQGIYELKVKEKVYGYTIYAQKTIPDEQTGKHTSIGPTFFYQCFDTDGDGKFETLVTDTSGMLIPSWASQ